MNLSKNNSNLLGVFISIPKCASKTILTPLNI